MAGGELDPVRWLNKIVKEVKLKKENRRDKAIHVRVNTEEKGWLQYIADHEHNGDISVAVRAWAKRKYWALTHRGH
jgi:hypothetical protein